MSHKRQEKNKIIENSTIKDVRNLFKQKNKIDDNTIKDIKNLFRLKKIKINN